VAPAGAVDAGVMRRPHALTLLVLLPVLLLVAGCTEQTEPATNVTSTSATLRGTLTVSGSKSYGAYWFEYSRDGGTTWTQTAHRAWGSPGSCSLSGPESGPIPASQDVPGLVAGSHYIFRMAATVCGSGVNYGDSNWKGGSDSDPPYEYDAFDTPSAGIPTHVTTWAYDDNWPQGKDAPASLVAKWVDYAEGFNSEDPKPVRDCRSPGATCKALAYIDAFRNYHAFCPGCSVNLDDPTPAPESWWIHADGYSDKEHRLVVSYGGDTPKGHLPNLSVKGVRDFFQKWARDKYDAWDGLMVDDSPGDLHGRLYSEDPPGYETSNELKSDADVDSENAQLAAALTHKDGSPFFQVDNGITPNRYLKPGFNRLNNAATHGFLSEGQPVSDGTFTNYYENLLDEMAFINTATSGFMVLLGQDPSGSLQARRDQAATVLLGWSPGHVVSWSNLKHDSTELSIWPEQGIYPTQPVQSMPAPGGPGCLSGDGSRCSTGGHTALEVAPGVYRREFARCYNQGVAFGRCAVIVNWNDDPVTTQAGWLTQSYGHTLGLVGGTVEKGGTVDLGGAGYAPGATIPGHDSVILTP